VHPDLLGLVDDQEKREEAVDWILRWSFGPGVDPALLRLARRRLLGGNAAALQADFHACNAFDLMGRLGDLSVPALVLCGEEDKMTPPKYSRYLAGHLPDAELVLIPGTGHMVMLEAPEAVARAILDFLARRFSVTVGR
jgi:pimeloyl-ACP methyl ester carboxylesterase